MLPTRYWVIDGKRQLRFIRSDKDSGTLVESRELLDVQVRLKHMDELGTDIQVIYPTLFLMEATERPEVSTALRRSYNRWLADRCGQSNGRLRWICLPPLLDMDETLKELRFAKEHGACGALKKGDREADNGRPIPISFLFMRKRNGSICRSVFIPAQGSRTSRRHGSLPWDNSCGPKRRRSMAFRRCL